jgi:hypothetical protein
MRLNAEQRGQATVGNVRQPQAEGQVGEHVRNAERQPAEGVEEEAVGGQHGKHQQHQPVHREPAQVRVQGGAG